MSVTAGLQEVQVVAVLPILAPLDCCTAPAVVAPAACDFTCLQQKQINQITQETISETMTSHFGLGIHASVQDVPRGHIPSTQAHIAGLWLTGMDGTLRSYVHECGG